MVEEDETESEASELSVVNSILFEAKKQAKTKSKSSEYRSTQNVSTTSCVCEQTNSQEKHLTETGRHMHPTEKLLVLKLNPDLWDKGLANSNKKIWRITSLYYCNGSVSSRCFSLVFSIIVIKFFFINKDLVLIVVCFLFKDLRNIFNLFYFDCLVGTYDLWLMIKVIYIANLIVNDACIFLCYFLA